MFGHFGDRIGRKAPVLALTLLLMGGASTLIGVLPTYSQIGMAAPALLVLLRAVQGFAVGGEWGGAVLLAVETSPRGERALRGSVVQTGAFIGLLLADGIYLILTYSMSAQAFDTWGWRVPFLISVVILTLGYWVRRGVLETPLFEQVKKRGRIHKLPLWSALKKHPGAFFTIIGMYIGPNVVTYIVLTFAISYAKNRAGVSDHAMLLASMVAAGGGLITIPLAARWGRPQAATSGRTWSARSWPSRSTVPVHLEPGQRQHPCHRADPHSCWWRLATPRWWRYSSRSSLICSTLSSATVVPCPTELALRSAASARSSPPCWFRPAGAALTPRST